MKGLGRVRDSSSTVKEGLTFHARPVLTFLTTARVFWLFALRTHAPLFEGLGGAQRQKRCSCQSSIPRII
jgi:hypothetical protein